MRTRVEDFFLQKCQISKDVMDVGSKKPVGYINLRFLEGWSEADIVGVQKKLEEKGLKTLLLRGKDCVMRFGALYAYEEEALGRLLRERSVVLQSHGWPTEPEFFVRKLALDWAPEKTALFDTIADAFNNKAHSGRTDVNTPPQGNRGCGPKGKKDHLRI